MTISSIEKIKDFNKKISSYNLIFKHYKKVWILYCVLLYFISFGSFFVASSFLSISLYYILMLIPAISAFILLVKLLKKWTLRIILKNYNIEYKLGIETVWDYKTIELLKIRMFEEYVISNKLSAKKLENIAAYVENEKNTYGKNFLLSTSAISITTGVLLSEVIKNTVVSYGIINFIIIFLIALGTLYLMDFFMLKDLFKSINSRKHRLVTLIYVHLIE